VPIRFTVTQPARVVTRAIGTAGGSYVIDSGAWNGQVNLSWPAGSRTAIRAGGGVHGGRGGAAGQNTSSASQQIRVSHGSVDTLPSLTSLPGYQYLPRRRCRRRAGVPWGSPSSIQGVRWSAPWARELEPRLELEARAGGGRGRGAGHGLRDDAAQTRPRPAAANILYNRLLRDQIARRNQDIAKENVARAKQESEPFANSCSRHHRAKAGRSWRQAQSCLNSVPVTAATAFTPSLFVTVTLPAVAPAVVGAKVTLSAKLCEGASVTGAPSPLTEIPAPLAATCVTVTLGVSGVRELHVLRVLLPRLRCSKFKLDGERDMV